MPLGQHPPTYPLLAHLPWLSGLLFGFLIELLAVFLKYPVWLPMRGEEADVVHLRPSSLVASEWC